MRPGRCGQYRPLLDRQPAQMRIRDAEFPLAFKSGRKFARLLGIVETGVSFIAIVLAAVQQARVVDDHEVFACFAVFPRGLMKPDLAADLLAEVEEPMTLFCNPA